MLPLISAAVIMLASLSGVIFASRRLGGWMERNLPYLATFSIGIFAVVTWGLFGEAWESNSILVVLGSAAAGMLGVKVFSTLIPEAHHHHDPHPSHGHSMLDGRKIVFGDAVHNISDGLLLVPAFLADTHLGVAVAAGILIHELVQGISEFFILKESGYGAKRSLAMVFAASFTIFIGIAAAAYLSVWEFLESPLIAFAAGGFLYTIVRDLVPHALSNIREKGGGERHIKAVVAGVLIMMAVNVILPHSAEMENGSNPGNILDRLG